MVLMHAFSYPGWTERLDGGHHAMRKLAQSASLCVKVSPEKLRSFPNTSRVGSMASRWKHC